MGDTPNPQSYLAYFVRDPERGFVVATYTEVSPTESLGQQAGQYALTERWSVNGGEGYNSHSDWQEALQAALGTLEADVVTQADASDALSSLLSSRNLGKLGKRVPPASEVLAKHSSTYMPAGSGGSGTFTLEGVNVRDRFDDIFRN